MVGCTPLRPVANEVTDYNNDAIFHHILAKPSTTYYSPSQLIAFIKNTR